jgi:hypothetical protein
VLAGEFGEEKPEGDPGMRRFLALAAAAGLLTGGLAAAAPAVAGTAAPAAAKALKWGKCAESDLRQAGAACAMLSVPLN